jgi:hypothetical protein
LYLQAHAHERSTITNKNAPPPDIRIHSNGAAESYGFRPLTDAGRAFVNGHAAMVKGRWQDDVFWFLDRYMPRDALNDPPLVLVVGIGSSDDYDVTWRRNR